MSDDEAITEILLNLKVARSRAMRAARGVDKFHMPIAHLLLMDAVAGFDLAEDAIKDTSGHRRLMEDMYPRGRFARTAQEIDALPELEES